MSKVLSVGSGLVLFLICGCEPLPTQFTTQKERPVEPLIYEKKGYVVVRPTPEAAPMPTINRRSVPVKPGKKLSASDVSELLEQAEDKAVGAENLAKSAQSKEDWVLVMDRWKIAIATLRPIVALSGAQKSAVQQRIATYQRNLANAQQQAQTNPRQIQAGEKPSENGIPMIVTSGEEQSSPRPSAAPTASPTAAPLPSASPAPKQ